MHHSIWQRIGLSTRYVAFDVNKPFEVVDPLADSFDVVQRELPSKCEINRVTILLVDLTTPPGLAHEPTLRERVTERSIVL